MHKEFDMVMLGAINLNLALRPVDNTVFQRDVTLVSSMAATPGGDAMNEAITASRLSNRVALCGKVGCDFFGELVLNQAKQFGVDISGVMQSSAVQTALGTQLIGQDGQRRIISYRGALETFCLQDVDMQLIKNTEILSIGSFYILKMLDGPDMAKILEIAKGAGAITSADTMQDTYGIGFNGIRACLSHLDYFLPSYEEGKAISGEGDPLRQSEIFLHAGCRNVIIKLGADGCFVAGENGERVRVPSCPTTPIDTTGAGDNFVAGFLTAVRLGYDIIEAARFASATAAISIQEMGSCGAVKSLQQVLAYRVANHY